jgi:hypothetical protein
MRHSCRWHFRGPLDGLLPGEKQFMLAGWHQDVLPFFHYLANFTHLEKRRRPVALSSYSFDGEITARAMRPFGYDFLRGSTGKKGARAALRGLLRMLRAGRDVVTVADGPGPPAHVFSPGPIYLARRSGVPLYVARVWVRPQYILASTWCKLVVPLPRADVAVFSAGPIDVSGDFEEARQRAENELHRLGEEADAHLFLRPRVTGGIRWVDRVV